MKTRIKQFLLLSVLTAALGLLPAGATAVADLSLSVSVGPQYLQIYSNIVYTITVSNAGPSTATGVMVSNQIPVSVNFVSATGGATPTDGILLV